MKKITPFPSEQMKITNGLTTLKNLETLLGTL
jgi:hypothetical protein